MSLTLVQWENSTVTPKLDAIMYDDGSYGIVKGCAITHQGTNLLKIASGFIKIAGRLIEVSEETITCEVSASGTVNGQLWIRLDLSSVTPAAFMTEAAAVLTPLTQNADCNFQNGIYELQLATYNIDESVITNLVETAPTLEKIRTALDNIDLSANKVTYDNTHSGLTATKVQGAIDEINDNLTDGIGGTTDKFRFGTDGNGNYGYIKEVGGADTFFPFKSGGRWEKITKAINGSSWTDITTDIEELSLVVIAWGTGGAASYSQYITFYEVNGTTMTILQMHGYTSSAYMGCRIDDGKLQAMFMGGLASSGVSNIYCIYDCEKEV